MMLKTTEQIRTERLREATVRIPLTVACLWPKDGLNLGTVARTSDAVGATMVIPSGALARKALRKGNTIGVDSTLYRTVPSVEQWLAEVSGLRWVAVELAEGSVPIAAVEPIETDTVLFVGHENMGVPDEVLVRCDEVIEIPMGGVGNSLNVAVATSMAMYKLAGLI